MRAQLNKLTKNHSTKAERRFAELCKRLHIPFKTKVRIKGKEVDFVIKRYAIEVDGHKQESGKNFVLLNAGYTPVHFSNWQIKDLEQWLIKIYGIS